jgi:hypothetical protein
VLAQRSAEAAARPQVLRAATERTGGGEPTGVDEVAARLTLDDAADGVVVHLGEELEALGLEHRAGFLHAGGLDFVVELFEKGVEVEGAGFGGLYSDRARAWGFSPPDHVGGRRKPDWEHCLLIEIRAFEFGSGQYRVGEVGTL